MFRKEQKSPAGLNIIIIGCGKVGATLLEKLSYEGHDITIIDQNPKKVQEFTSLYDAMGVVGNGASYSVQMEAGVKDADLLIAVTGSDELNLLCCVMANQEGNCSTIARVRNPEYTPSEINYLRDKLGIAIVVNPELEAAKEVARILYIPTALEVTSFAHGQAELVKFKIPEHNRLDGITLAELGQTSVTKVLFCAVVRDKVVHIPDGSFELKAGDIVSFVATRRVIKSFFKDIGINTHQVKSTMIIGGGKAAFYLAQQLIHMGIAVKIVEQSKARCEELSILLPEAVIINGDGTDTSLLLEEGIEHVESFVPLTGIDEENVMLTLYARQVSDTKTITKVARNTFREVISNLDLGSVVYPRYITAETIIRYVRAKQASKDSDIETLSYMYDNQAEAIEFIIKEDSRITNIPLAELPLKKNLLLAFISRNGSIIFPTGKDHIQVGDAVMIVTTHSGFNNILDILA